MDCSDVGSTIAELKLKPHWWRLSPNSAEVYLCERYGACNDTRADGGNATATLRSGINGTGCRDGHRGPLCSVCEAGWAKSYDGLCEQCTDEVRERSLGIIVGVLVASLLTAALKASGARTLRVLQSHGGAAMHRDTHLGCVVHLFGIRCAS